MNRYTRFEKYREAISKNNNLLNSLNIPDINSDFSKTNNNPILSTLIKDNHLRHYSGTDKIKNINEYLHAENLFLLNDKIDIFQNNFNFSKKILQNKFNNITNKKTEEKNNKIVNKLDNTTQIILDKISNTHAYNLELILNQIEEKNYLNNLDKNDKKILLVKIIKLKNDLNKSSISNNISSSTKKDYNNLLQRTENIINLYFNYEKKFFKPLVIIFIILIILSTIFVVLFKTKII